MKSASEILAVLEIVSRFTVTLHGWLRTSDDLRRPRHGPHGQSRGNFKICQATQPNDLPPVRLCESDRRIATSDPQAITLGRSFVTGEFCTALGPILFLTMCALNSRYSQLAARKLCPCPAATPPGARRLLDAMLLPVYLYVFLSYDPRVCYFWRF